MSSEPVVILSSTQIEQKINRIARQILEKYHSEEEIILVGIAERGFKVAERIGKCLSEI